MLNESDLVLKAQQGDNDAFEELMSRHYDASLKLALSILKDRSDAEDEAQNAWWKIFEHIGQFQGDAKFSTWMTRIVVNQCLMRLRQTRRAKFLYMDDVQVGDEGRTLELPATIDTPEKELGRSEVGDMLMNEIQRIPPMLRKVFELRELEELSMADVADRLGITVAAAKSRLLRARVELRSRLERHYGRLGPATLTA